MLANKQLTEMLTTQSNLSAEGQQSRRDVNQLVDTVIDSKIVLQECLQAMKSIHDAAENFRNDEVLLHSGALVAKLTKFLSEE